MTDSKDEDIKWEYTESHYCKKCGRFLFVHKQNPALDDFDSDVNVIETVCHKCAEINEFYL